ncbi:MAG: hypothetical protein HYV97_18770 [Bdellovibrio sp.]|nr:hypothetical protein [Bdellovibrio sp.]
MSKAADIYAWGTASDLGQRLRKASVFHQKLSGKYDRRVDYLMLKMIFDLHSVHLFECKNNAISIEQSRRTAIYGATAKGACIRGLINSTRAAIATEIYEMFKTTSHYQNNLNAIERKLFDEFVFSFWLAKLKHPTNPARTFYYGDCLEPGFIHRTLARPDLIPVIEKALNVKF